MERKTSAVIILLVAILASAGDLASARDHSFREGYKEAKWGMSKSEVKDCFADKPMNEQKDNISCVTGIVGLETKVLLNFFSDQLYNVSLFVRIPKQDAKEYLVDFKRLEELLTSKYGNPRVMLGIAGMDISTDDIFRAYDNKDICGKRWAGKETDIDLIIYRQGNRLELSVQYNCRKLLREKQDLETEKAKREL